MSSASQDFHSGASKWTGVVFWFLFALVTLPLWLLFGVIVVILRILVSIHYKVVHEGKFHLCSPADSAYAVENDGNTISIYAFCYIRGQTDIYQLRDRVTKQLLEYTTEDGHKPYQKLTWKLIEKYGFFTWESENDSFDVRDHVKLLPGTDFNQVYSEQHVTDQIMKMYDYIMPSKYPQWELLFAPKVRTIEADNDDDLHYALILRTQHAYMDGVSVCQLLSRGLCDQPPKVMIIDPVNPPIPKLSLLQRIGLYTQAFFMAPYTYALSFSFTPKNVFTPEKQRNSAKISPKMLQWSEKLIPFETLKLMRAKFNCSTTAIFHSVIAGALRKAANRKSLPIPKEIDFCYTLAVLPYPHEGPQNRFTVKLLQAPIECADPVERLSKLTKVMKSIAAHEVLSLYTLSLSVGLCPVKIIRLIYQTIKCGFVVTNLPAFENKLIQFGNTVEKIYGSPPIKDTTGFGIGIVSYGGNFRVSWLVEESKIISSPKELEALIKDFNEEFEILEYT